jgi:PAS domain S-box-containing protein
VSLLSIRDEVIPVSVSDSMKILDTIHDGFFLLDVERDEILDANGQACELLGYDLETLLSLNVSDVHPDEMHRLRELASDARSKENAMASDLHCLRKDGRKIPIEVSACAIEPHEESRLAVIVRDISNVKRQNHYLKVFERVLRHNLRNRINVVLNRAELIEMDATDEYLCKQSQILCETVDGLVEVIEDIRSVQQSLRNEVDPSCRFDCATAIEEIVRDIEAEHPKATVTTELEDPLRVRSDDRLTLALEHLIENAVVHNNTDHPHVEIIGSPVDEHSYVELKIVDDGPGIPDAERYVVQNPEENSPLEHGTGTGLWIAAMIVFTIDGDVLIENNEPGGTIVTLQLPCAQTTNQCISGQ